jgi:flagellar hook assembly protein FlgD
MIKDDKLIFNEKWNLKDNKGNIVPPGTYTIKVEVMIDLYPKGPPRIHSDDLTARTIFKVN